MLQMFVLALSLYNTWNRGVFLLCKITNLLIYSTNNNNRALTGFWIESSLKISPKEQVEVMERIFGTDSTYSERTQNILKQVMLISEENNTEISIYGKTGMGKAEGIVVDAWFTGFAETLEGNKYFCVYLGQSDAGNTSSTAAKEIAIQILNDNK